MKPPRTGTPPTLTPPTSAQAHHAARVGLVYGLAAYFAWGLVPLYFKQVAHVPPLQVLSHRVLWSVLFLVGLLAWQGQWTELRRVAASKRTLLTLAASTALIAVNWLVFIYAVSTDRVLYASLGYFINPLVSVLLGMVFLRERLRPWQAAALALAIMGVAYLGWSLGSLPWISVVLPVSFALYGLLRKTVAAGPLVGLFVETLLLLPLAATLIGVDLPRAAQAYSNSTWGWLLLAGVVTAVPLLWFANAVRRLRLSTIGFLQYVGPSCQLLLATLLFREPFSQTHLVTFCFIWTALVLYSVDSLRAYRQSARARRELEATPPGTILTDL